MTSCAAPVLLYLFNNPPGHHATVVAPIAAALREAWDGAVLCVHEDDLELWLGAGPGQGVRVAGTVVTPARAFVRSVGSRRGVLQAWGLAAAGATVVNAPAALEVASSKFAAAAALNAAGVRVPEQFLLPAAGVAPGATAGLGALGWPLVVKADRGSQGRAVWLAEDAAGVSRLQERAGDACLAQRFHADAAGADVRVLVAGDRVVAGMRRQAAPGEFRANLARGGSAHPVRLTAQESEVARAAAAVLGLTVAGVDLLRTAAGPLVTEVNPNPELKTIAQLAGAQVVYPAVAEAIVAA